jgi:hypothetical protein
MDRTLGIFLAEPRRFAPLTSARHRRIHTVVFVCCCSKTPANKRILLRILQRFLRTTVTVTGSKLRPPRL